uniref:RloB-like protein n=1 Tax=Candidatus Kentrum eta TaxID=2126337 RepID=A0A450UZH1_9GAMM|nr:MAG: RloB-like protein [Candidatus Kentron sp. H]VFJ90922.1 MAG: RloB-like protein [Candidatus Kentron sp. H]VFJ97933.1 MAG: RloB-like protein [Candidatus Kentron sp. H]
MGRAKPRKTGRSEHPASKRVDYDRVLIVCEGKKTEPHYFEELRRKYRLNSLNVVITPADGTDPMSVVRTAKRGQRDEREEGERYDRVYCVFDRDEHANFDDASRQLENLERQGFRSIRSWPCFEFWLLLHFQYTRRPFERDGRQTGAQHCESALRARPGMGHYRKGAKGLFTELLPRLEDAKANAARALHDAKSTGENNPSTEVHELVDYLQHSSIRGGKTAAVDCEFPNSP